MLCSLDLPNMLAAIHMPKKIFVGSNADRRRTRSLIGAKLVETQP
jgi:hypothetical protein